MTPLMHVARRQGGVFTRRQAAQCGVPQHAVEARLLSAEWVMVADPVMAAATTPLTPLAQAWAGLLAIGSPVALAGRFGASYVGLDRAPAWPMPQFAVPDNRHRVELDGMHVWRLRPRQWSLVWHRGLPVLPTPTLIRQVAFDAPEHVARDVVQHALRRRRVVEAELLAELGRGRPGAAALRRVLEELAPGYQSLWERRLHRKLLSIGVRLKPQTEVVAPDGRRAFLDLGDDDMRFGVELDGFLNHMARFAADRKRARLLAVELEWTIAPYAVEELARDLDAVALDIAQSITRLRRRRAA